MTCKSEQEIRERLKNLENELIRWRENPNNEQHIIDYFEEHAYENGGCILDELYVQIDLLKWILVDGEFDGSPDEDPEYGKILMENIQ